MIQLDEFMWNYFKSPITKDWIQKKITDESISQSW